MFTKFALVLLFCSVTLIRAQKSYKGYKIYDINAKNRFEKDVLLRLSANHDYDFFVLPKLIGYPARVMVKPEDQAHFENELTKSFINFTIINKDLEKTIAEERLQNNAARSSSDPGSVSFDRYLRFSEINAYLDALAKRYSNRVSVKTVGKSYQGRDMKTITITNGDGRSNKKLIFIDAGIHAREWIAPATALYTIKKLVEDFSENAHLLKDYDWIVLPIFNPDGYEYTHTSDRNWRHTRKPVNGSSCIGTDANRNFDFHWGEVGVTSDPCDPVQAFEGETAFSEPETKIVRDIMHSISGRAKMYLTLHSFGNYLLYPWGYTSDLPNTWKDLDEVAQAGASAIRTSTGTKYRVGTSPNLLYHVAGSSMDYAIGKANIPVSITMELPAGETNGFDPSPAQIKHIASESWIGIKAMAEKVIEKY